MIKSLTTHQISTRTVLIIILLACVVSILLIGHNEINAAPDVTSYILGKFSAFQLLQIYFLSEVIRRISPNQKSKTYELAIILLTAIGILFIQFRRPEYALAFLTISVSIRLFKVPSANIAALSIGAFGLQYAAAFGPLFILHQVVAPFDATIVRIVLTALGFAVEGTGTFIRYAPTGANLDVNVGCTSSLALIHAICGAFIYAAYQNAKANRQIWGAFFILLLAIIIINWLRMGLMIESKDAYKFWHEGTGMQIVSLINAAAIIGIMHLGILRARATQIKYDLI